MWTVTNGWLRNQLFRIFELGTSPQDGDTLSFNAIANKFDVGGGVVRHRSILTPEMIAKLYDAESIQIVPAPGTDKLLVPMFYSYYFIPGSRAFEPPTDIGTNEGGIGTLIPSNVWNDNVATGYRYGVWDNFYTGSDEPITIFCVENMDAGIGNQLTMFGGADYVVNDTIYLDAISSNGDPVVVTVASVDGAGSVNGATLSDYPAHVRVGDVIQQSFTSGPGTGLTYTVDNVLYGDGFVVVDVVYYVLPLSE